MTQMMSRPFRSLAIFLAIVPLTCGVAWLHYTKSERVFEAHARIRIPTPSLAAIEPPMQPLQDASADNSAQIPPSVLTSAIEILKRRGLQLALSSPLDSEAEELAARARAVVEQQAGQDEIRISYATTEPQEAVPVLTAIVDAYLKSPTDRGADPSAPVLLKMETERKALETALPLQQKQVDDLQQQAAQQSLNEAARLISAEKLKTLSGAAADARRRRLEAEARLVQTKQDMEAGALPIELLVARLPDGATHTLVHGALTDSRLKLELEQQAGVQKQLAAVYGRNHPQRIEQQKKVDDLQAQLNRKTSGPEVAVAGLKPAEMLLRSLESELATLQALEQDFQLQLDAESAGLNRYAALQKSRDDAQRELARLHTERDGVQQRIETAQRQQTSVTASVIEPPTLSPAPISPNLEKNLGLGGAAGLILGCLACWALSPLKRAEAIPATVSIYAAPPAPVHLSFEERRRARAERLEALRAA